jgi:hypothetical protein
MAGPGKRRTARIARIPPIGQRESPWSPATSLPGLRFEPFGPSRHSLPVALRSIVLVPLIGAAPVRVPGYGADPPLPFAAGVLRTVAVSLPISSWTLGVGRPGSGIEPRGLDPVNGVDRSQRPNRGGLMDLLSSEQGHARRDPVSVAATVGCASNRPWRPWRRSGTRSFPGHRVRRSYTGRPGRGLGLGAYYRV